VDSLIECDVNDCRVILEDARLSRLCAVAYVTLQGDQWLNKRSSAPQNGTYAMDAKQIRCSRSIGMTNWLGLEARVQVPTNESVGFKCRGYSRWWQDTTVDEIQTNPAYKLYRDCIEGLVEEARAETAEIQHWWDMAVDVGTITAVSAFLLMLWLFGKAERR